MRIRYYFGRLSSEERAALEAILLEEMEIQSWFAVSVSVILGGEVFFTVQ